MKPKTVARNEKEMFLLGCFSYIYGEALHSSKRPDRTARKI